LFKVDNLIKFYYIKVSKLYRRHVMLRNKIFRIIIVLFLTTASAAILSTGCYQDERDARVTINLQRNDLAENGIRQGKHLIDRILEFFSSPLEASFGWDDTHGPLTLTVSGSNIDTLIFSIPQTAESYTLTVPAVNNVNFVIYSTTTLNAVPKNWGGQITTSLSPGEQNLAIKMIPMTKVSTAGFGNMTVSWEPISAGIPNASSYRVYKSDSIDGTFTLLIEIFNIGTTSYIDPAALVGVSYYYRVSVNGSDGEGVMCDPVAGTRVY
jgi:hypothetical protein